MIDVSILSLHVVNITITTITITTITTTTITTGVIIDEATMKNCEDAGEFDFTPLGPRSLKGMMSRSSSVLEASRDG